MYHTCVYRESFVSTKFRICHFRVQIFSDTSQPSENLRHRKFPVLNFLLRRGITGRPSKLNVLQRSCEGHHTFVVTIAYGIHLLEREPCNVADQYHSSQYRKTSNRIACIQHHKKTHQTTHYYNELLKAHVISLFFKFVVGKFLCF